VKDILTEEKDYYYNENGLMVLTEAYHKERGYCCGNGCLHCPFNFEAVPEPRKSFLQIELYKANNSNPNS
jgi:hypothetical protein